MGGVTATGSADAALASSTLATMIDAPLGMLIVASD